MVEDLTEKLIILDFHDVKIEMVLVLGLGLGLNLVFLGFFDVFVIFGVFIVLVFFLVLNLN